MNPIPNIEANAPNNPNAISLLAVSFVCGSLALFLFDLYSSRVSCLPFTLPTLSLSAVFVGTRVPLLSFELTTAATALFVELFCAELLVEVAELAVELVCVAVDPALFAELAADEDAELSLPAELAALELSLPAELAALLLSLPVLEDELPADEAAELLSLPADEADDPALLAAEELSLPALDALDPAELAADDPSLPAELPALDDAELLSLPVSTGFAPGSMHLLVLVM